MYKHYKNAEEVQGFIKAHRKQDVIQVCHQSEIEGSLSLSQKVLAAPVVVTSDGVCNRKGQSRAVDYRDGWCRRSGCRVVAVDPIFAMNEPTKIHTGSACA